MSKPILISICDDNDVVRDAIEIFVRSLGYNTAAFVSAEEFLSSGLAGVTSCLLSDIQMPGMSGVELHHRLRAEGRPIPVIFVTGNCEDGMRPQLIADGAVDVLAKPFDTAHLTACLKRALAG